MNASVSNVIENIAEDVLSLAYLVLDNQGLEDSRLKDDLYYIVETSNNPIITLFFNDYLSYIENGRLPVTSEIPPISDLRDWALRKGIPTDNDTLYAIAQVIRKNGMAPRPILAILEEKIEKAFIEDWADNLFEAITKELSDYFNE